MDDFAEINVTTLAAELAFKFLEVELEYIQGLSFQEMYEKVDDSDDWSLKPIHDKTYDKILKKVLLIIEKHEK